MSRLRPWQLLSIALMVTAAVYARALGNPFWADDYTWIGRSIAAHRDMSLPFTAVFGRDYNPLTYLSFALNLRLAGAWAPAWHLVDLAIHLGCAAVLFDLARKLTGSVLTAFAASLMFGAHVAIAEPVIWSAARVHSQALLFLLLGVRASLSASPVARYAGFLSGYLVAINFKETAITYPLVPLALALWGRLRRTPLPRGLAGPALAGLGLAAAYGGLRYWLLPVEGAARSLADLRMDVAATKLALTILSFLGLDERLPPGSLSILLPIGALLLAGLWPRDRVLAFGSLYAVVLASGYFPAFKHSSRYCYLPWPGLALVAARLGQLAWRRASSRILRAVIVLTAALGFAWSVTLIHVEIGDYRTLGGACVEQVARFSDLGQRIEERWEREGDFVLFFVDRSSQSPLAEVVPRLSGRQKLIAMRRDTVEGLLAFGDLLNINLYAGRRAYYERSSVMERPWDDRASMMWVSYGAGKLDLNAGPAVPGALDELARRSGRRLSVGRVTGFMPPPR